MFVCACMLGGRESRPPRLVCVREQETDIVCVCVCTRERDGTPPPFNVCVRVCERERYRKKECVCVFVCVWACMYVCVRKIVQLYNVCVECH